MILKSPTCRSFPARPRLRAGVRGGQRIISAMPGYKGHQLQRSLTDPHRFACWSGGSGSRIIPRGFRGSAVSRWKALLPLLRPLPHRRGTFRTQRRSAPQAGLPRQPVLSRADHSLQARRSALWAITGSAKGALGPDQLQLVGVRLPGLRSFRIHRGIGAFKRAHGIEPRLQVASIRALMGSPPPTG